jgi:hypothetical protein
MLARFIRGGGAMILNEIAIAEPGQFSNESCQYISDNSE